MNRQTIKKSILLLAMIIYGHSSFGQKNPASIDTIMANSINKLEEVVVSDSKFGLKRSQSGKPIIKITAEEIAKSSSQNIVSMINAKSGIEINGNRSAPGQNLGYFVRGGTTKQVLVLLDGVQMLNSQGVNNEFDLRLISKSSIESIEIIKGASSVLYGSNAATAVINIITKKSDDKKLSGYVSTIFGTNKSQKKGGYDVKTTTNNVYLSGKTNRWNYLTSAGYQYADGMSSVIDPKNYETDILSKVNALAKIGYTAEKFKITTSALYNQFRNTFDNSFPPQDAKFYSTNEQYRIGLQSEYTYNNGGIYVNTAYDHYNINFFTAFLSKQDATTYLLDVYNKNIIHKNLYTLVGINYQNYQGVYTKEGKISSQFDSYVNVIYTADWGLNINTGVRYNEHSKYGGNLVYNINPSYSYKIDDNSFAKLFTSYGTSFIAPNLLQLFGPFGANTALKPERNTSAELGFNYTHTQYQFTVTYFHRVEQEAIGYIMQYVNIEGEDTAQGFELETKVKLGKNINWSANYTFVEREKNLMVRVPKHKVNSSIGYQFDPKTNIGLKYQFVGERTDKDFSTFPSKNVSLSSFSLLDLKLSRYFLEDNKLQANLDVNNLLNEEYTEILGYYTKGRNILLGLRYHF